MILGSLSKNNGDGNKNVIPKCNLTQSQVFGDYSAFLFTLYNTGELSCNWMGTNGFNVKIENEWFIVTCSRCHQNLNFGNFTLWFCLRLRVVILGSLNKNNGDGNENVIPKCNLTQSQVFGDYSAFLFTLYNTGELSCNWMGTNGFNVKIENEWFIFTCSRCHQNLNFGNFTLWFCLRLRVVILGSFSKNNGDGNENVIPKCNLTQSQVFGDYSAFLFTLYNTGELSCNWMGTNGFNVKIENEWFIVTCSRCHQNLNFGLWSTAEKCTEIRAAPAARAFFTFLTNDILALWRCSCRSRRLCLNSLMIVFC